MVAERLSARLDFEPDFVRFVNIAAALDRLTRRIVPFEDQPRDTSLIESALLWVPEKLAERKLLGLVWLDHTLWMPISADANRIGVTRLELVPIVRRGVACIDLPLVRQKPTRTVRADLSVTIRAICLWDTCPYCEFKSERLRPGSPPFVKCPQCQRVCF